VNGHHLDLGARLVPHWRVALTPHSRLVWTNDEGDDGGAVTTVTFQEKGGQTLLVVHDLYPSKEALDGAIASGSTDGMPETLDQLEELLVTSCNPGLGGRPVGMP
jgi:uncharacterized protein YndB with AHSA1/START domain